MSEIDLLDGQVSRMLKATNKVLELERERDHYKAEAERWAKRVKVLEQRLENVRRVSLGQAVVDSDPCQPSPTTSTTPSS